MKYHIGDIGFNSKKSAEDFTRNKLEKSRLGYHDGDSELFDFLGDLINLHPNADYHIGEGIEKFHLSRRKMGMHLEYMREDNFRDAFSWKKCTKFQTKDPERDAKENLNASMRFAIKPFVDLYKKNYYKKNKKLNCDLCDKNTTEFDPTNYHTDHIIYFRDIKKDFLEINQLPIPNLFDDHHILYSRIFRKEDSNFENNWIEFHNEKAIYRILCAKCNQCNKG